MAMIDWLVSMDIPERPDNVLKKTFSKVNTEIPTLVDYSYPPNEDYWSNWPRTDIPFESHENQGTLTCVGFHKLYHTNVILLYQYLKNMNFSNLMLFIWFYINLGDYL